MTCTIQLPQTSTLIQPQPFTLEPFKGKVYSLSIAKTLDLVIDMYHPPVPNIQPHLAPTILTSASGHQLSLFSLNGQDTRPCK
jgi:hypothetical protein